MSDSLMASLDAGILDESSLIKPSPCDRYLTSEMGIYFDTIRRNPSRTEAIFGDLPLSISDVGFRDMLMSSDNHGGTSSYEYLRNSDAHALFAKCVYYKPYIYPRRKNIPLISSDMEVMEIDKSLAESESGVWKMLINHGSFKEMYIQVSANVLKEIILFLEKKRDFEQAGKVVGKVLRGYKSWSTYFINRNEDIMVELHKAAKELRIPSLLALTSSKAYKRLRFSSLELRDPNACSSQQMFHYLISLASDPKGREAILIDLDQSCYDSTRGSDTVVACEKFTQWFTEVGKLAKPLYEDFENLMKSSPFKELCMSLYKGNGSLVPKLDQISLRSDDGHDLKMDKSVATPESVFLHDRVDSNRGLAPIDVPADRDVLSQVADYFYIPSLLVLTANELGNSLEKALDEVLWWCKKVSLPPILMSLFAWDI